MKAFFGVIARAQTYKNILYVWTAFPLGIVYFVLLVVGIATGLSIIYTFFGPVLLLIVGALWLGLAAFERGLTHALTGADIVYASCAVEHDGFWKNLWENIKVRFLDGYTWKSLLYLFLKFPLGIIYFVVSVVSFCVSLAFIISPYLLDLSRQGVFPMCEGSFCFPQTMLQAWTLAVLGLLGFFVTLHVHNGLAWINKTLAEFLLSRED